MIQNIENYLDSLFSANIGVSGLELTAGRKTNNRRKKQGNISTA